MKELELKYGCNPNQKPSRIYMENGELPIKVLKGKPIKGETSQGYSDNSAWSRGQAWGIYGFPDT